jgi:hypothetical protein
MPNEDLPFRNKRIASLQAKRKELLQSPSNASGGAARDARMKKIKEFDKAILAAGGKIKPIKR